MLGRQPQIGRPYSREIDEYADLCRLMGCAECSRTCINANSGSAKIQIEISAAGEFGLRMVRGKAMR